MMHLINTKKQNYLLAAFVFLSLILSACSDDPVSNQQEVEIVSLFIVNEGNWSDGNGSITSYNPESSQTVQDRFQQVNGRPLAGIIQRAVLNDGRLFIVANNTDKIEVTDMSFESIATIMLDDDPAMTPSAFAISIEQKGYVSGLYSHSVAVVDLEDYTVGDTRINVGDNPRDMIVAGSYLYVANNGFGDDNTVTVIDTETDEVVATVTVGNGPVRLKADSEGRIWVVCSGKQAFDENWNRDPENDIPGRIDVLSPSDHQVISTIETGGFPKSMVFSESRGLGWIVNEEAVQLIDMNSYELLDNAFISRSFNGIGFSTVEDRLYLAHSRGYTQNGQAIIYDPEGAAADSFQVGIAPMDFLFHTESE